MTKDQAVRHFGSTTALARALLISYQAVHSWEESVPALRQLQIEMITGGALKAERSVYPKFSPTLNENLRPISTLGQSTDGAVNPSSTGGAR